MVVRLVFARRVPRAWNRRLLRDIQGVLTMQQQFWMHVQTMWRYAKQAATKNPEEGTTITITQPRLEREKADSDIEFFIVDISNPFNKACEELEYKNSLVLFEKYNVFKRMFKDKVPESNFFSKPLKSKYFNIDTVMKSMKKQREAGEEEMERQGTTVAEMMLKLGVMSHVGKYETLEEAENAFLNQEQELLEEAKSQGMKVAE